jgi:hypothetical protein
MITILTILLIVYFAVGITVYFLTMEKSDALKRTIDGHSPLNSYIWTNKWLWLMIVCLWPIWLLFQDRLPGEEKRGPF